MSITVIGAFSRMGILPSTDPLPVTVNVHQLPGDVLYEIFKYAHQDSPTSLLPVMRANSLCYGSAVSTVYHTIHLNRATVRGLMTGTGHGHVFWNNGRWINYKWNALAKADRLVIDDIAMLFDEVYDSALRSFISCVKLPNVSKITFCQDESMKWIKEYDGRTFDQMMYRGLPTSRAGPFSTVVPLKNRDVCIRFPPRGDFQRKTSPRILEFISYFSGKSTIRIHQSANDRYLTLSTVRRGKSVYSFYPDPSGVPAKDMLFNHFKKIMAREVSRLRQVTLGRWDELYVQFEGILNSEEEPEDKMRAAKEAIRDPSHQPQPVDRERWHVADMYEAIEHLFGEMMDALNPDCESVYPCCGDRGSPINA